MEKYSLPLLVLSLILLQGLFLGKVSLAYGTADGSEEWGYVEVRPKAHMFWWLYRSPQRVHSLSNRWPIILWLQGGPGASGVGLGNFIEIGPLDQNLKPRNSTWLQKADLLFVDNPVGTGFSFVENESLVVKTDEEAATDLTALLKVLFNKDNNLQKSALFIVGESYGGKFAVMLGLAVVKAIKNRELKLTLGGVSLGDSWISPEDYVFSWGPLLRDVSRLDENGAQRSNSLAEIIKQQIQSGQYLNATNSWRDLEGNISVSSNGVDFYNFLLDSGEGSISAMTVGLSDRKSMNKYSNYLISKASSQSDDLSIFMDVVIRKKVKIVPQNVSWGGQSDLVFSGLGADFMKPRIKEVDKLLSYGVNVTIYNGQLDVICATRGTEAWLQKLKWDGLKSFHKLGRTPLFCKTGPQFTKGFTKSYKNLKFYWILGAGHLVPMDQPCIALQMIGEIVQSYSARKLKG